MKPFGKILKDYNPNQPRVPSGSPEGGQWTSGSGSFSLSPDNYIDIKIDNSKFEQELAKHKPENLKKSVAQNLAAKLSENEDFSNLINGVSEINSMLVTAIGSSNYEGSHEELFVSALIEKWARTSADHDYVSVAMQLVAKDIFNLDESTVDHFDDTVNEKVNEYFLQEKGVREGLAAFLKAQYDSTQQYYKDNLIKEVYVARGVKHYVDNDEQRAAFQELKKDGLWVRSRKGNMYLVDKPATLQPLSSFSTDPEVASSFGSGGGISEVMFTKIPVEKILANPVTGFGCKSEKEVVVMGGKYDSFSVILNDPQAAFEFIAPSSIGDGEIFRTMLGQLDKKTQDDISKIDTLWARPITAMEYMKMKTKKSFDKILKQDGGMQVVSDDVIIFGDPANLADDKFSKYVKNLIEGLEGNAPIQ